MYLEHVSLSLRGHGQRLGQPGGPVHRHQWQPHQPQVEDEDQHDPMQQPGHGAVGMSSVLPVARRRHQELQLRPQSEWC